jgi:hypothetical protein
MRLRKTHSALLVPALASAVMLVSVSASVAASNPNEVLSIEGAHGTIQIRGRGFLNMRVAQGVVQIVDSSPTDQFSPRVGGVPRGRSSSARGNDINVLILGGRYKVLVRGTGISVSARGDGQVTIAGESDASGGAGTVRIGDAVRPIAIGESRAVFGGLQGAEPSTGPAAAPTGTTSTRDEKRS